MGCSKNRGKPQFSVLCCQKGQVRTRGSCPKPPTSSVGLWGAVLMHPWPKPTAEVPGVLLHLEGVPAPQGCCGLMEEPNPAPWCSPGACLTCRAAAPVGKVRAVTFSLHLPPFPIFLGLYTSTPPPAAAAAGLPIPEASNTIPAPASPHQSSHSRFSLLQIFPYLPKGIWGRNTGYRLG